MLESNLESVYVFLRTFYGGVAIGFCYDLLVNVLFKPFKSNAAGDIFFSISAFCVSLSVLFGVTQMHIRFYMFCGFGLGWWLYFKGISKFVLHLRDKIFAGVFKGAHRVYEPIKRRTDRFVINNKHKIAKYNLIISRMKNIPNRCKTSYNKYIKYIRIRKSTDNGEKE